MIRKLLISTIFAFICLPSYATTLADVEAYVDGLLNSGVAPTSIMVTLDVDGTLTNYSMPGDHETKPRGNAVPFVTKLIDKGVKVVVASAWDKFEETRGRLEDLKLLKVLKAESPGKCGQSDLNLEKLKESKIMFEYCHSGHVSSVKDPNLDRTYYRQKAFAYKKVYPKLDIKNIKHHIFADDSSGNVKHFNRDIKRASIFESPPTTIKTFTLTRAQGEPELN